MIVMLLTEHHLEFLSRKGGCRGFSKSTLVKMSNCWKSHATAQFCIKVRALTLILGVHMKVNFNLPSGLSEKYVKIYYWESNMSELG